VQQMSAKGFSGAACALALMVTPIVAAGQNADPAAQPQAAAQPDLPPPAPPAQQAHFSKERLDQLLAPVALYPDELVTNVMMASTYPTQVVEASRWLKDPQNAALKGDALLDAIRPMSWDPSVKFLMPFPSIVKQMDDHLDWMQDMGAAFTYQQADAMAEVQHLRQLAMSCGKLQSTSQMTVSRRGGAIAIAPANPAVAYVPVYNPAVVYGAWPYPAYPPLFFPPPPGFVVGAGFDIGVGIGFSVGFDIVGPLWGWAYPNWGAGVVNVDVTRVSRFTEINNTVINQRFAGGVWRHDALAAHAGALAADRHVDPRTGALRTAGHDAHGVMHGAHHYAYGGHHGAGRAYAHAGSGAHGQHYAHAGGWSHGGGHHAHGGAVAHGGFSGHGGHVAGGGSHGGPARGPAVAMAGGGGGHGGGHGGGASGGRQHGH
jgi:hypothetical protein